MRRHGRSERQEQGAERTCIVTRAPRPPESMIRFVLDPAGQVVADIRRRLPGRGVWVSANAALVEMAVLRGAFSRAFKRPVLPDPALPAIVDTLLERDLLQALAMANKAGLAVAGAFQVEKALSSGDVGVLLHATDGGEDGRRKFRQMRRRAAEEGRPVDCIEFLSSQQISLALGRASVIHAALRTGAATAAVMARARRLLIFRSDEGGVTSPESGTANNGQHC